VDARRAASVCGAPGCPNIAVLKGRCLKHAPKPWGRGASGAVIVAASFAATRCRRSGADGSTPPADDASAAVEAIFRSCSTIPVSSTITARRSFFESVATDESIEA
jgi:hypothetical protein